MKLSAAIILAAVSSAAAFAPAVQGPQSTALNAQMNRKAFIAAAGASIFAAAPMAANAGSMAQELVKDPTEVWETGAPSAAARAARNARAGKARNQMNSSFPPIKRLTLERKSPVTRLDTNAPSFGAYKKTYPGLFPKE
mmetsp:Transcript_26117/g.44413  ORF Transcript_26117/g.44413 Transcript_26117/m.44413 type:complete len:139 (-) Transcript_26117:297-713(-)